MVKPARPRDVAEFGGGAVGGVVVGGDGGDELGGVIGGGDGPEAGVGGDGLEAGVGLEDGVGVEG